MSRLYIVTLFIYITPYNLYAEYIIQNTSLDEAQAGIKTAGRNINNLRYSNKTTLLAESEDELMSRLMEVKEENVKAGLKLNWTVAQLVKNLPAMQETWVQSLGWEDPLEKGMATHSSILAWRIPWTEELADYTPWSCKDSDVTEWLNFLLN